MTTKTNAVRLLERLGIAYELLHYEIGAEHKSAQEMAELVGKPAERVFKTLLARCDKAGPCFAVLPGPANLNLKALARAAGSRKATLASLNEVTPTTGYVRGGVTALAAKKPLPTFLDESAQGLDWFIVSAGARGTLMQLVTDDYVRATCAVIAPLTQ